MTDPLDSLPETRLGLERLEAMFNEISFPYDGTRLVPSGNIPAKYADVIHAVPALLAEVRRLREENERVRQDNAALSRKVFAIGEILDDR